MENYRTDKNLHLDPIVCYDGRHITKQTGRVMQMLAIQTKSLVKRYKNVTAVDNINLEVLQGELFSLLGVNGAGKTTTIKMLTGLTKPSDGDALIGGCSITKQTDQVKQLIGVSPQETAVAPNLSVRENLELICGIYGFSKEKTIRRTK